MGVVPCGLGCREQVGIVETGIFGIADAYAYGSKYVALFGNDQPQLEITAYLFGHFHGKLLRHIGQQQAEFIFFMTTGDVFGARMFLDGFA